jgi:predicted nucleotidyltransferase
MELDQNFKEFIALLNEHKVDYLIVGGYAVVVYGYHRFTGDLDIWVKPTSVNGQKLLGVLRDYGFGSLKLNENDFSRKNKVIQLGYEPLRIDILTSIDGMDFDKCYKRRKSKKADGIKINFIGLEDLRKNKKLVGRHRDLEDYKHLKKL